MIGDGLHLEIDTALAERLRIRAEAAGLSVEAYALGILGRAVEEPGFRETETQWNEVPVIASYHIDQNSEAYADELDRICDEALRTGGIPFEVFQARLRNLGQRR